MATGLLDNAPGLVDEDLVPPEKGELWPPEPNTRLELVEIPSNISPEQAQTAMAMGINVLAAIHSGGLVMFFPQVAVDQAGKRGVSIGSRVVPLSGPRDIEAIVNLGKTITEQNIRVANAKKLSPSDQLAVNIEARREKDNAARAAIGHAKGTGGIIVPGKG